MQITKKRRNKIDPVVITEMAIKKSEDVIAIPTYLSFLAEVINMLHTI